ncbi:hypothetical protein PGT21_014395 [Puccinia graminis f. sp. tritici]|uniref:Tet-like 2OG-Fe(II) oxygenase domain-containing protein n=1 Tax=Puccinia graminis f. sp. tritici TaxID=56615 RepID=A0A5B0Q5Z1_PUCGR|nr:hypothetical protein PGT21_014395 [Puccinia graminis f. sp. tritici]
MFKSLGHIPFESNRQLMQENEIPSFASGKFNTHLSQLDCAPHITFTSNGFYNQPHRDKGDASEFAFGLFVPTKTSDGTLVDPIVDTSLIKDSTGGQFVFPDYQFCIKFKPDVVVKVVWAAKRCKHCTLPGIEAKGFTRVGMSLQITKKSLSICQAIKSGLIYLRKSYLDKKKLYFGGHRNYMGKSSK